jgi:hypothetical protein
MKTRLSCEWTQKKNGEKEIKKIERMDVSLGKGLKNRTDKGKKIELRKGPTERGRGNIQIKSRK